VQKDFCNNIGTNATLGHVRFSVGYESEADIMTRNDLATAMPPLGPNPGRRLYSASLK
jgi:hypothetical protein